MAKEITRRFTLADAMILIGAIAWGSALARWREGAHEFPRDYSSVWWTAHVAAQCGGWFLLPFAPMLGVIQLRDERRSRRRLFWLPGFQACMAVTLGFLAKSLYVLLGAFIGDLRIGYLYRWVDLPEMMAPIVVGTWTTAALVGRRRAEGGWIDRCGRAMGWGWIVLALSDYVLPLFGP